MTYCLAMRLDEGLVFLSDTRTNAGVDNVSAYRKLHVLDAGEDRSLVLQSAGNLATTQEVLDRLRHDLDDPAAEENLATVDRLFEAALYVGRVAQQVSGSHKESLEQVGADGTSSFILGGQIRGDDADILLIYPQGNYIRASDDRPFLQIGETKYGKFMLELAVREHVDLRTAAKIALSSMMSTARANLSVAPPYDAAVYLDDTFRVDERRIEPDSPYLAELEETWSRHLHEAVNDLPMFPEDLHALRGY